MSCTFFFAFLIYEKVDKMYEITFENQRLLLRKTISEGTTASLRKTRNYFKKIVCPFFRIKPIEYKSLKLKKMDFRGCGNIYLRAIEQRHRHMYVNFFTSVRQ